MAYIGRDIQYGVLDKQSFTANSSTTAFSLDSGVKNAKSLLVSIGGIIQEPDVAYTASGTTLTFTTAPATGMTVYAIYLGKTLESGGARDQITFQNETGDGTTTPFTLSAAPVNAQSIMVTLNGVTQVPGTDYIVAGTTITFTTAPVVGMGILVYHLGTAAAIGEVTDASITDAKIVGMNASKLTGSLPANTVPNTSIVTMDAAKLTGTLPSSMEIDTTAIDHTIASLGMHVAVADNKASFNLPGVFIDQFESDTGILTETTVDRDATGEYFSSIVTTIGSPVTIFGALSGSAVGSGFNNYQYRQILQSHTATFHQLRATVTTTGAGDVSNAGIGQRTGSFGDTVDTPVEFLWGGTSGASGADQVSDWLTFTMTDGVEYIWSLKQGNHTNAFYSTSPPSGNNANANGSAGYDWNVADVTDQTVDSARSYFLMKLEGRTHTSTVSATGTLISAASTAPSATTTASGVMVYEDASGTATLGTDLKVYFSADDGANWTEAASYGSTINFNGASKKLVKLGKTTGLTSGTQMKLKAEWANQAASIPASGTAKTITASGDAQHSTTQNKIGTSSILFDGTGDYLSIPINSDFNFGSSLWTVEFWYKSVNSDVNSLVCLGDWDGLNGPVVIYQSSDGDLGTHYNLSTGVISNEGSGTTAIDTGDWVHIAVSRTSATTIKAFVNGTEDTSVGETISSSATMTDLTTPLTIGRMPSRSGAGGENNYDLTGYMDEIRVSDTARYTANFTPSTTAFTSDANTVLLIHSDTTNTSTTFIDSSPVAGVTGKETRLHGWAVNY